LGPGATCLQIQELAQGQGPSPAPGDTVLIDYVLRRPNGYFIYSTVEGVSFQPRDIPVGPVAFRVGVDPSWIQGLQEVVAGMRQGGKLS
ncbi:peptidylprolyl isomerase, partial [Haematococcus lacustris]